MKNLLVISLLLLAINSLSGQIDTEIKEPRKGFNTIYLEVAGSSIIYGLNYERSFMLKKARNRINGRIGISNGYIDGLDLLIPVGISLDLGKNKSFFQINLNRTFDLFEDKGKRNTSFGLAYARRPINGFYFHISVSYYIFDKEQPNWDSSFKRLILPGIGLGLTF